MKKTACICNTKRDIKYVFGSICKTALKCLSDTEEVGVCLLNCGGLCVCVCVYLSLSLGERLVSGKDLAAQAGMLRNDRRPV